MVSNYFTSRFNRINYNSNLKPEVLRNSSNTYYMKEKCIIKDTKRKSWNISFSDMTISCLTCKANFVFSIGEQRFYKKKQLFKPTRCKPCRKARKKRQLEVNNRCHSRIYSHRSQ